MLSVSSGLILAIIRLFEGYSSALKSLCKKIFNCKKKTESLETDQVLLDPSDQNKNKKDNMTIKRKNYTTKNFGDIEKRILENVL